MKKHVDHAGVDAAAECDILADKFTFWVERHLTEIGLLT